MSGIPVASTYQSYVTLIRDFFCLSEASSGAHLLAEGHSHCQWCPRVFHVPPNYPLGKITLQSRLAVCFRFLLVFLLPLRTWNLLSMSFYRDNNVLHHWPLCVCPQLIATNPTHRIYLAPFRGINMSQCFPYTQDPTTVDMHRRSPIHSKFRFLLICVTTYEWVVCARNLLSMTFFFDGGSNVLYSVKRRSSS